MKKTLVAVSLAAFACVASGQAFAADPKPCDPPKAGYEQNADGKCVESKKN